MSPNLVAIILHSPPCAGKTEVSKEIRRRSPTDVRLISLDEGWGAGEPRLQGGLARYADLRDAGEAVLVIEIGSGEPADLSFAGATRGAEEWIRILRAAHRELYPFLYCGWTRRKR